MAQQVQIIATIGPSSRGHSTLRAMLAAGVDVVRLNFSWGTHDEHEREILSVREVAEEAGKNVLILQDLSGPRVQTGATHGFNESAQEVLTEKDKADLVFGARMRVEAVALSFVGSAQDIKTLRDEMQKVGLKALVVAKIERKVALEHIDEIIAATDAVMIARGDLGNEVPLEQIPFIERDILAKAKQAKKPVIVATQMMLSMTHASTPSRAEVTDVAQAVLDGADAVMLSEETASGMYPTETVKHMRAIVTEASNHVPTREYYPLF